MPFDAETLAGDVNAEIRAALARVGALKAADRRAELRRMVAAAADPRVFTETQTWRALALALAEELPKPRAAAAAEGAPALGDWGAKLPRIYRRRRVAFTFGDGARVEADLLMADGKPDDWARAARNAVRFWRFKQAARLARLAGRPVTLALERFVARVACPDFTHAGGADLRAVDAATAEARRGELDLGELLGVALAGAGGDWEPAARAVVALAESRGAIRAVHVGAVAAALAANGDLVRYFMAREREAPAPAPAPQGPPTRAQLAAATFAAADDSTLAARIEAFGRRSAFLARCAALAAIDARARARLAAAREEHARTAREAAALEADAMAEAHRARVAALDSALAADVAARPRFALAA